MAIRQSHIFLIKVSLGALLAAGFGLSCSRVSDKSTRRPNFIFIIIDDQNQDLSPFGRSYVKTPNLDRLASQGVIFSRAYVQQAVCAASRASFLTGLHPEATGVEYPYSQYFVEEIIPKYGTVGSHFFRNDYFTRYFGKVHHGFEESLSEPGFSPGGTRYLDPENIRLDQVYGNDSVPPYEEYDAPDSAFRDGRTALAVLDALSQSADGDQPFFFAVGFAKPHLPFSAPKRYWDLYERHNIPLVPNPERPGGSPDIAISRYNLQQYHWEHADPERLFSDDYARLLRHAYFACTSFVDAQIGLIMNKVEELGISDNTYFVYISDHGFHLGEQNHWGKTSLHEANLKSPVIISHPQLKQKGRRCDALVEYVDILPTLLDLADLEIPGHLEGVSLTPLLQEPDRTFKSAVFSQQERDALGRKKGFSIRTDRYRYTEWRNTVTQKTLATELYDLLNDSLETRNVAYVDGNRELIEQLSLQLRKGWRNGLPPGVARPSINPLAPPAYSYGNEGTPRRQLWHEVYGGDPSDGWRRATELRTAKEDSIRSAF